MIHVIIGTKGQIIKMFPILKILEERGISYNYIDTGQHEALTKKFRMHLKMRDPDYICTQSSSDITKTITGLRWMMKIICVSVFCRKQLFKGDKGGLCLVHGDTVSTFLGAVMGKLSGQRVVHVEAGYRTNKLFKPFPEELIRRLVDRWSDINFVFKDDGEAALKREGVKGKMFHVKENTVVDAVEIAKQNQGSVDLPDDYFLISVHRYETIYNKSRMEFIVDAAIKMSRQKKVVWGLHEPTKHALQRYNLYDKLAQNENIILRGIFDYFDFIYAIYKSDFLMTDGGGPQDETKFLGIPCLLVRTEHEKPGYGNVCECPFDEIKFNHFMENRDAYRQQEVSKHPSPSAAIVDILAAHNY